MGELHATTVSYSYNNAKQKTYKVQKGKASQKQQLSDYSYMQPRTDIKLRSRIS